MIHCLASSLTTAQSQERHLRPFARADAPYLPMRSFPDVAEKIPKSLFRGVMEVRISHSGCADSVPGRNSSPGETRYGAYPQSVPLLSDADVFEVYMQICPPWLLLSTTTRVVPDAQDSFRAR